MPPLPALPAPPPRPLCSPFPSPLTLHLPQFHPFLPVGLGGLGAGIVYKAALGKGSRLKLTVPPFVADERVRSIGLVDRLVDRLAASAV